jgi:hypothetical protein
MHTRSLIALAALLATPACREDLTSPSGSGATPQVDLALGAVATDSVLLVVAGDMHANCTNPANKAKATAALVQRYPQALVIPSGDNAGQSGTSAEYTCYDQSWGAFKRRTYPTIGNHESNLDLAATAYYDYFNGVGVDSGRRVTVVADTTPWTTVGGASSSPTITGTSTTRRPGSLGSLLPGRRGAPWRSGIGRSSPAAPSQPALRRPGSCPAGGERSMLAGRTWFSTGTSTAMSDSPS